MSAGFHGLGGKVDALLVTPFVLTNLPPRITANHATALLIPLHYFSTAQVKQEY
jgi:hypothetical protein